MNILIDYSVSRLFINRLVALVDYRLVEILDQFASLHIFITEILRQIFQNFTNMLRKSKKFEKRKFLCSAPLPPSHYSSLFPTIRLQPPPHYPVRHNGNLSACDQKMSRLCHATTISPHCTHQLTLPNPTIYFHYIFRYTPVF